MFQRLPKLSANSAAVVVALQEIEMGSGSVAMAAAKDVLMKRQQVSALHHDPNMRDMFSRGGALLFYDATLYIFGILIVP